MNDDNALPINSEDRRHIRPDIVDAKLLELANDNFASMLLINVTVGLGISYLMLQAGHQWIWSWLGVFMAVCAARAGCWYYFNTRFKTRLNDPDVRIYCQHMFGLGLMVTCALWSGLVWVAVEQASEPVRYALLIIVSAMAGGATGSVAPLRAEGRVYILLMLVPSSLKMVTMVAPQPVLCVLGLIFAGVMVLTHAKNHKVLRDSLSLRLQNDGLVNDLTDQNRAIQDLNATLEQRVDERTEALRTMAYTDPLTGLLNRRGLMEWMAPKLRADDARLAVLFLDLDRFKQINDAMGHDVGDQVLILFTARLRNELAHTTTLARWGGDEFVVIAIDESSEPAALELLTRTLQTALSHPFDIQGKTLSLGVSIGTSRYPHDAVTGKELIHAADLAAAEVKRTGRGQVIAYKAEFAEVQRHVFDLSRELSNAIAENEFRLAYQPIVDTHSGEIEAFEVLLRWQHPRLGAIAPDVFIPLAEDTDRICEIGDWVLRKACEAAMGWEAQSNGHLPKVAVNVSVQQLLANSFVLRLALVLEATRLPPSRLEIEVTESLFDETGIETVLGNVMALRALGVDVHIDDFGTGYSSLSRLHQFPVTAIKIDKSFVAKLEAQGGIIIESTVMIARRFGLKVVAEGVETAEQAHTLSALGVDYLQGYYLARPQFEPLIKTYNPVWDPSSRKTA